MIKRFMLLILSVCIMSSDLFSYQGYRIDKKTPYSVTITDLKTGDVVEVKREPTFWENYGLQVVGGCVAIGVAAYLYQRESNSSLIRKTNHFYAKAYHQLHNTHGDVVEFAQNADVTTSDREIIFKSKKLLIDRYTSWVKPWDWSAGMKLAYRRSRVAAILYGYLPLFLQSENLNGEYVLRFARETFVCINQYPCVCCLMNLQEDIAYLKKHMKNIDPEVLPIIQQILKILINAKNILRSEKEFLDEFNIKTQHDLQRAQLMADLSRNY